MGGRLGGFGLIALVALGCDARAGDEYRGDPLLTVTGTLVVDSETDWSALEPVVVFSHPDRELPQQILNVDTRGEFPAKFTVDLMQPPPAAAMQRVSGMPSFAIGALTALPREHGAEYVRAPSEYLSAENSRFEEDGVYYLLRESCLTAGECYQELRRCMDGFDEVCSTIIEQHGDPAVQETVDEIVARGEPPFSTLQRHMRACRAFARRRIASVCSRSTRMTWLHRAKVVLSPNYSTCTTSCDVCRTSWRAP